MVGYPLTITDPSYYGQLLLFTYPLLGNYGVPGNQEILNKDLLTGFESSKIHTNGIIISQQSNESFHWNSFQNLHSWLKDEGVPGIAGVDTRQLTLMIRDDKNLFGEISDLPERPQQYYNVNNHNIAPEVSTKLVKRYGNGSKKIGILDLGIKWNIIRKVIELDCEVELYPWDTDLSSTDCNAFIIGNGPGDPRQYTQAIEQIKKMLSKDKPILGICLGSQLLALASGATVSRMDYGHRGHNHPVKEIGTNRGFITSQNHGYVVDVESLSEDWTPWFCNLNDDSLEGFKHKSSLYKAVQFHPEASSGPHDTSWIISEFINEIEL